MVIQGVKPIEKKGVLQITCKDIRMLFLTTPNGTDLVT